MTTTRRPRSNISAFTLVSALLVQACASTEAPSPPSDIAAIAALDKYAYAHETAGLSSNPVEDTPWQVIGGPELEGLVAELVEQNLDLLQAQARIRQAEASLRRTRGGLLPSLSLVASDTGTYAEGFGGDRGWSNSASVALSADWDTDIFGAQRRSTDAARIRMAARELSAKDLQRTLAEQLSTLYVNAWSLHERLLISEALAESFEETEALTAKRYRSGSGTTSALEVQIARQNLASARADVPSIRSQYLTVLLSIDALLGRVPGETRLDFSRLDIHDPQALMPVGVPADLLRRRGDVAIAELNYRAGMADLASARASRYPSLTLSGSISGNGDSADEIFDPDAWVGSLIASLLAPVYRGGQLKAAEDEAAAIVEELAHAYAKTALAALSDVEAGLISEAAAVERLELVRLSLEAATVSEKLATERYSAGQTNLLSLLETRRALNTAQLNHTQAQENLLIARITLFSAYGGAPGEIPND